MKRATGLEKLERCGYPGVNKNWIYVYSFRQNSRTWRTLARTDRRTDGRTPHDGIGRPCITSRGKTLLNRRRSRLMLPSRLQISLRPRVTLTFNLLIPKADVFMSTICVNLHQSRFTKHRVRKFYKKKIWIEILSQVPVSFTNSYKASQNYVPAFTYHFWAFHLLISFS